MREFLRGNSIAVYVIQEILIIQPLRKVIINPLRSGCTGIDNGARHESKVKKSAQPKNELIPEGDM